MVRLCPFTFLLILAWIQSSRHLSHGFSPSSSFGSTTTTTTARAQQQKQFFFADNNNDSLEVSKRETIKEEEEDPVAFFVEPAHPRPKEVEPTQEQRELEAARRQAEQEKAQAEKEAARRRQKEKAARQAAAKREEMVKNLSEVVNVTTSIARDLFGAFRKSAAVTLTASLPTEERSELLARTLKDKNRTQTFSVSERMAAEAVTKAGSQRDEDWEREKERIYQQAEQATQERIKAELAIQQQRMQEEKARLEQEAAATQQQLQEERVARDKLQQQATEAQKAAAAQGATEKESAEATAKELEKKLKDMEETLRNREEEASKDKEKIQSLTQDLEAAVTTTKPSKNKIHSGHYTPKEYKALTADEKEMVAELRKNEGLNSYDIATSGKDADSEDTAPAVHPILGPVISDLCYKRVHLVSAEKLASIPIWEKQRVYRHRRVKAMANDKWKSMQLGLPGVICLHEDKNGKLSIIDGQHRVGMMMVLLERQRQQQEEGGDTEITDSINFDQVLVEVYPQPEGVTDHQHARDIFVEINKAEPVKLVDMPGVAKAKDRNVITDAVDALEEQYPMMFSPSQRCRAPNVNVDNLRNSLFGSNVMKKHKLNTSKKMLDWVLQQNELLAGKYENDEDAQNAINPKVFKKASKHGFYLGLESTWLYN